MATQIIDSFAHRNSLTNLENDLYSSVFGGTNPTIVADPWPDGWSSGWAFKSNPTASTSGAAVPVPGTTTQFAVGCIDVGFDVLPNADCALAQVFANSIGWRAFGLWFDVATGKFKLETGGLLSGAFGSVITTGRWYHIDFSVDIATATWHSHCTVDGEATQTNNGTGAAPTNGALDWFVYGVDISNATATLYLRNALLRDDADVSAFPLGQIATRAYQPSGVGVHNLDASTSTFFFQFPTGGPESAITSSETTSYSRISSVPLDTGSDYVTVEGATPTDTWYLEYVFNIPLFTVAPYAVRGLAMTNISSQTAGSAVWATKLYENGTEATLWSGTFSYAQFTDYTKLGVLETKPSGGAWTPGALQNVRFRYGYSSDAVPNPRLHNVMLEVAFLGVPTVGAIIPPITVPTVVRSRW